MTCDNLNYEGMVNALKNKSPFFNLTEKASVQDIVNSIIAVDAMFEIAPVNVDPRDKGDDQRRYALVMPDGSTSTEHFLEWRVTDRVAQRFRRGKTAAEIEAIQNNPNNILRREYGTNIHQALSDLGGFYYARRRGETYGLSLADIRKTIMMSATPITEQQFGMLADGVRHLVDDIYAQQQRIDPNGSVTILFERMISDPVKNVGGTVDVMAIFSDKTAMIYDYKTFSPSARDGSVIYRNKEKQLINRNYASYSKREGWKEQMSGYRRILLARHGVKNIRGSRIVPIWIDFKSIHNKQTNGYDIQPNPRKIQMGEHVNEELRTIIIGTERMNIPMIDSFLQTYYERMDKLREQWRKSPREEKDKIAGEISLIEDAIQQFIDKDQVNRLIYDALMVAQEIRAKIDAGESFSFAALNEYKAFLEGVSGFLHSFEEQRSIMEREHPDLAKHIGEGIDKIAEKSDLIHKVLGEVKVLAIDALVEAIPDRFGSIERDGQEIRMRDDGMLRQMMLPGSDQENPITRYVVDLFMRAHSQTRQDLESFEETFATLETEVRKWARARGESLYDVNKYLLDERGDFFKEIDSKFYALRTQAKDKDDVSFFTRHYQVKEKNSQGLTYEQWYARREQEVSDLFDYQLRDVKEASLDEYKRQKAEKMDFFKQHNDLTLDNKGNPIYPNAWMKGTFLEMKPSTREQYRSAEYQFILDNKPLNDYYQFMHDFLLNSRDIVGYDLVRYRHFFPKVRASVIEMLSNYDFASIAEEVRTMLSIREDETGFGNYDVATGELDKRIPVFFTNPTGNNSRDIGNTMRLFAKVVFNYKHMTKIEATALAAKEVMSSHVKFYKTDSQGRKLFDKWHNIAIKEDAEGASLTEQVLSTLIDYHLYGINMQVFNDNPQLTKNIMMAKNYFSLKTLGLGFIPGAASYVAAYSNAIMEGRKGLLYSSAQYRKALLLYGQDRRKYLSLAYTFGIFNGDLIEDVANTRGNKGTVLRDQRYSNGLSQYLNDRMLMRPFSYGDERLDNQIAVAMALNYGIDARGNIAPLRKLPEGSPSIYDMFSVDEKSAKAKLNVPEGVDPHEVMYQFRNAVRDGNRRIKGTITPEDSNYAQRHLILNLLMQFKTWMPGVITERFGKVRYNDKLNQMEGGRYNLFWKELTATEKQEGGALAYQLLTMTGNALLRFGKLLMLNNRVANLAGLSYKLDPNKLHSEFEDFQQRQGGDERMTLEDYKALKEGQLRAAAAELEVLLLITGLLFAMAMDWDDDGEPLYKDMYLAHLGYKILNRVKTEISFTFNPAEYARMVTTPFPLSSLVGQAARFVLNTADETRDIVFGENSPRDDRGSFYYAAGFIPGGYQLSRVIDLTIGGDR